jgi:hypothetical protein
LASPSGRPILAESRQASRGTPRGVIHIFEERCIAASFRFRFARDKRFIAAPHLAKHIRHGSD